MADTPETLELTLTEIKKLKVAELKSRLSTLGLPTTGLKADLVARLASFLEAKALEQQLRNDENSEDESNIDATSAEQQNVIVVEEPVAICNTDATLEYSDNIVTMDTRAVEESLVNNPEIVMTAFDQGKPINENLKLLMKFHNRL
ncbi:uncharacterized protein LOC124441768 [Xenia sp. Carnegie-2017]|uniref:uncharacterized protein LOC124441768 n=1 Tax=Xenia sp. Carnegie-2017 TaxID=2897299 RepID=UPI001F034F3C|nr:uncharacterized protein LOC124441768 [Xenia sp. Carnegie-2017]